MKETSKIREKKQVRDQGKSQKILTITSPNILDSQNQQRLIDFEGEQRFRTIVETFPGVIWMTKNDPAYTPLYLSDKVEEIFGYPKEDFLSGRIRFVELVLPEDLEKINRVVTEALTNKKPYSIEIRFKKRDGSTVWINEMGEGVFDEKGNLDYLVGSLLDITERKQAEILLRESEERFRSTFEQGPVGMVLVNPSGKFIKVNVSFCAMLGYSADELIEKTFGDVTHPDDLADSIEWVEQLIAGKAKSIELEKRYLHKQGTVVWGIVKALLLRNEDGTPRYFVTHIQDSTSRKYTENALKESEKKYRELVENINDIIFTADESGIVTYINPVVTTICGYSPADIIGKHFSDFIYHEDIPIIVEIFKTTIAGKLHPFVYRIICKSGELRWVRSSSRPIVRDNSIIGLQGVITDITGQKKAEEKLHSLSIIVEQSRDAIIQTDTEFRIEYMNPAAEELFGYRLDEIMGQTPGIFNAEPKFNDIQKEIYETIVQGKTYFCEEGILNKKKDGSIFICQFKISPLYDSTGKVYGYMGTQRDITERKLLEQVIRESRERYRTVVDDMPALICRFLPNGIITFVNDAFSNFIGRKLEELIGENFFHLIPIKDPKTMSECISTLTPGNPVTACEHEVITLEGTLKNHRWTYHLICDQKGQPVEYQAIGIDITEHKQLEEERMKTDKLESIGVLAGGIAHDFNNILTVILGNISLSKVMMDKKREEYKLLSNAEKACLKAKGLTTQLLTFALGGEPIKETATITDVIVDSTKFCLMGSNVKCEFNLPEDLWSTEIDAGQITQVFNNLIINANHAMPQGGTLSISGENCSIGPVDNLPLPQGEYIKITVKDQGFGIPKDFLQKIFDPYFTTKKKGSGLGLTIAYSIVKKHDGYISVESTLGIGTTFTIYLPASGKRVVKKIVKNSKTFSQLSLRILVMDDEESVRNIAQKMLSHLGNDTVVVSDGTEAIHNFTEAIKSKKPFDLVILDLTIPGGMGGQETIAKLLEIDPHIKAIVTSGYSQDPILSDSADYGFKGVITKPYLIEELEKVVSSVMFFEKK
jgi:PAS domain S-box-containing protein